MFSNYKTHQISVLSHVITVSTKQNAIIFQIIWENERFYQKKLHLDSSAVYNSSAKSEMAHETQFFREISCPTRVFVLALNSAQNNLKGVVSLVNVVIGCE